MSGSMAEIIDDIYNSRHNITPRTPDLVIRCTETSPPPSNTFEKVKEIFAEAERNNRSSPPNCAICLGAIKKKCFTDSCMHQFCFNCLLEWSKIKAECPLCKQNFKSIIHNVISIYKYDEHKVAVRAPIYPNNYMVIPPALNNHLRDFFPASFGLEEQRSNRRLSQRRSEIYMGAYYAMPLPDFNRRFRDSSAQFYRDNPAQLHRLIPFIVRDVNFFLGLDETATPPPFIMDTIENALTRYDILSDQFINCCRRVLPEYYMTQFVHELYNFATSPYDLIGYYNNVTYTMRDLRFNLPSSLLSNLQANLQDWPDLMNSIARIPLVDLSDTPAESRIVENTTPLTINSESSDCEYVSELKAPHLRTPEQINLTSESDSDVIYVEETAPSSQLPSATNSANQPGTSSSTVATVHLDTETQVTMLETKKRKRTLSARKRNERISRMRAKPSSTITSSEYGGNSSEPQVDPTNIKIDVEQTSYSSTSSRSSSISSSRSSSNSTMSSTSTNRLLIDVDYSGSESSSSSQSYNRMPLKKRLRSRVPYVTREINEKLKKRLYIKRQQSSESSTISSDSDAGDKFNAANFIINSSIDQENTDTKDRSPILSMFPTKSSSSDESDT